MSIQRKPFTREKSQPKNFLILELQMSRYNKPLRASQYIDPISPNSNKGITYQENNLKKNCATPPMVEVGAQSTNERSPIKCARLPNKCAINQRYLYEL